MFLLNSQNIENKVVTIIELVKINYNLTKH